MANILIVSANLRDWTKNSGGKERTATLAEALTDHNITFLSFAWNGEKIDEQINDNIHQIQLDTPTNVYKKYRQLIAGPAAANHDVCFEMLKDELVFFTKVCEDLSSRSDLVIVDHMSISPIVSISPNIPVIYNSHNAEIVMAQQLYPDNPKLVSIVEKIEKNIISKSSAVTYCSKQDFKELEDYYGKIHNSSFVPNGAVMQDFTDIDERIKSKNIIFVGSGHPPNVIAANKLVKLSKMVPEYNFIVIGSAGNNLSNQNLPRNLKVLGHVSDEVLHEYFANSFAFINPMDSGSGTHLKMMKALSYGIPIITSKVGARGFSDKEISEAMLIAESFDEMHHAITSLERKNLYAEISKSGYKHAKTYDWKKINKDYQKFVNLVIETKPAVIEQKIIERKNNKEKVLIYSIIRNRGNNIKKFYSQVSKLVAASPEYDFYLSIYENDSTDNTKQELFNKDWSFFKGVSIISEDIQTQYFTSVKDAQRVENLSYARNKAIEAGGFLDKVDYVLMIEGDVIYSTAHAKSLLDFKKIEPDFDIVSTISLRQNGKHYDWWATRTGPIYNPNRSEIEDNFHLKKYGKYYSTSNGLCLYRAKAFQEGVRHHWINKVTNEFDCEMVVLCQGFHEKGYSNIYILYDAEAHHI